jgi:hypothetical protein
MPIFGPFIETMDIPKFSVKISMSFDATREMKPQCQASSLRCKRVRQADKAEATEDRGGD